MLIQIHVLLGEITLTLFIQTENVDDFVSADIDHDHCVYTVYTLVRFPSTMSLGGSLAHAFLPSRGEAHFDMAERWTLNRFKGRNLFLVTAHEIGHTLGLVHSPVRHALMSPFYKKMGRNALLSWDDITAIQQFYGKSLFQDHMLLECFTVCLCDL